MASINSGTVGKFRTKCQNAMTWADYEIICSELYEAWCRGDIDDGMHDELCGILELYLISFSKLGL